MSKILPHLFLGDIEASQDLESLNEHNIHHIVSILAQNEFFVPTTHHLLITLNDGEPYSPEAPSAVLADRSRRTDSPDT